MPVIFLPSPAVSDDCITLDLEAILDAQRRVPDFRTPHCGKQVMEDEGEDEQDGMEYHRIASLMTSKASRHRIAQQQDVEVVQKMLVRASLPLEVLYIAYNILSRYADILWESMNMAKASPALTVLSSMALASIYADDESPSLRGWSKCVCARAWTPSQIDETYIHILNVLDWRIHSMMSPEAMHKAKAEFEGSSETDIVSVEVAGVRRTLSGKVVGSGRGTVEVHGQLTPENTPTSSSFGDLAESLLPLL